MPFDVGEEEMLRRISSRRTPAARAAVIFLAVFAAVALVPALTMALAGQSDKPAKPDKNATTRLRIEVTGGDANKPVADASVYVRYPDDKKFELDLKTNQEGVARSPEIRQGKILIQIVAPGWKTYGEYHDISETEPTIQVHLLRPTTHWY
jgi:hypothetical protein